MICNLTLPFKQRRVFLACIIREWFNEQLHIHMCISLHLYAYPWVAHVVQTMDIPCKPWMPFESEWQPNPQLACQEIWDWPYWNHLQSLQILFEACSSIWSHLILQKLKTPVQIAGTDVVTSNRSKKKKLLCHHPNNNNSNNERICLEIILNQQLFTIKELNGQITINLNRVRNLDSIWKYK